MAIPFLKRSLLLFFLLFTFGKTQQIDALFTLDSTCNPFEDNLNEILTDARTMLTNAINAANTLQTAKTFLAGNNRNLMRNARHTFGTTFYSKTTTNGFNADDKETMSTVASECIAVPRPPSNNAGDTVRLGSDGAYLSCSDASYQFTTDAHDIDSSYPVGTSVRNTYALNQDYALYVPNNPFITDDGVNRRVNRLVLRPNAFIPASAPKRICQTSADSRTVAETTREDFYVGTVEGITEPLVQVVLCPAFFNDPYRVTIQGVNPGSSARALDYQFRASAFIHEMFHIFGGTYSDTFYYETSGPNANVQQSPYGAANIYAIATRPDDFESAGGDLSPTTLPDAYRTFVDMCNWPGTVWSSGVAGEDTKKRSLMRAFDDIERLLGERNATESIENVPSKYFRELPVTEVGMSGL